MAGEHGRLAVSQDGNTEGKMITMVIRSNFESLSGDDKPRCEGRRGCNRRPTRSAAGRRVCGHCARVVRA